MDYSYCGKQFVTEYLDRGFGAMTKSEMELLLFRLLLKEPTLATMTNSQISRILKVSEAKVRNLRYQIDLLYTTEKDLRDAVRIAVSKVSIKNIKGMKLELLITSKMTQQFIREILERDNRYTDTLYNSNVITMYTEDFCYLVTAVLTEEEKRDLEYIIKKEYSNEKKCNQSKSYKDYLVMLIKGIVEKVANKDIAEGLTGLIREVYNQINDGINKNI